jgi:hypothetical protein
MIRLILNLILTALVTSEPLDIEAMIQARIKQIRQKENLCKPLKCESFNQIWSNTTCECIYPNTCPDKCGDGRILHPHKECSCIDQYEYDALEKKWDTEFLGCSEQLKPCSVRQEWNKKTCQCENKNCTLTCPENQKLELKLNNNWCTCRDVQTNCKEGFEYNANYKKCVMSIPDLDCKKGTVRDPVTAVCKDPKDIGTKKPFAFDLFDMPEDDFVMRKT